MDHKWAFKGLDQKGHLLKARERATDEWIETEQQLFECSSEDSDGIDADYDDEWGENTMLVFSRCRGLEVNPTQTESVQGFLDMIDQLQDTKISLTEQLLIWSAIRTMFRQTEPTHSKRWLTSTTELAEGSAFTARPALDSFLQVAVKASTFSGLTETHRNKARRWSERSMTLFHKRVTALKEFGCPHPTWSQVKVCDLARNEMIPKTFIHNIKKPVSSNTVFEPQRDSPPVEDLLPEVEASERVVKKRKSRTWVSVPHFSPPGD